MPVSVNGNGTITGVTVGGLPDGIVDTDMLAANAVATEKIADDAVTDPKENLSGTAKAWVNFNGSGTVAIRDSFNVSSITDHGTGSYEVNYQNAMANTNYVGVGGGHTDNDGTDQNKTITSFKRLSTAVKTTSSRIVTGVGNAAGTGSDSVVCCWVVFGDQ